MSNLLLHHLTHQLPNRLKDILTNTDKLHTYENMFVVKLEYISEYVHAVHSSPWDQGMAIE